MSTHPKMWSKLHLTLHNSPNMSFHTSHIITFFGILVAIRLLVLLVQSWLHPLRDVPGPFWARLSRLWYLHAVSRGDFHKINVGLHQKHGEQSPKVSKSVDRSNAYSVRSGVGSVVRIAPGQYSIDDPEALKIIYSHSSQFVKVIPLMATLSNFSTYHNCRHRGI